MPETASDMSQREKRTQRDYTLSFKLGVVKQVEKGELSCKQAQVKYGIQGRSTVVVWLRKHGRLSWSVLASAAAMPIDKTLQPLTPEQGIKGLEVQLKDAQQKAQLFEAAIDVLRKKLRSVRCEKALWQVLQERCVQGLSVSRACQLLGCSRQRFCQGCLSAREPEGSKLKQWWIWCGKSACANLAWVHAKCNTCLKIECEMKIPS